MVYYFWVGDGRDGDVERIENGVRFVKFLGWEGKFEVFLFV